jgi:hypothetical protein
MLLCKLAYSLQLITYDIDLSSMNFNIDSLQKPLTALNNPILLFFKIANVSSKKWIQLLLLLVLPLIFQQLATIFMSLIKANNG